MSDDDDPFEAFETPDEDEEADPFADLEDAAASAWSGDEDAGGDDPADDEAPLDPAPGDEHDAQPGRLPDDPFDRAGTDHGDPPSGATDAETASPEDDAAADDGAPDTGSPDPDPAAPTDDPFTSFTDVAADEGEDPFASFESAGVEGVDPDVVWESLSSAEAGEAVGDAEKEYAEVSKHRFCENCEHFSGPPAVHCTYEGAAIVEFLDMETVRLVNCPIVAEQRALEEGGTDLG